MSADKGVSRRDFMRKAAGAAVGVAAGGAAVRTAQAAPYKSILPASVLGANERILAGFVGLGGMGTANLNFVMPRDDFQPIAVCDIYPPHKERAANIVSQKWDAPTQHHDFREVIENKDIDAVVVATPDHWHAIPAIMACDAGKDVYCEKPLGTTIEEGRHIVEAVKRNKTVLQAGTIQRSGRNFQEAVELVRSGYLGQVPRVETWIHDWDSKEGIGNPPDTTPPEGCDWIFHQGWTPHVPFNENRWLYNFRWFLEYSGGKVTDWGVHLIDIVLWAMGEDKRPRTVTAAGGKFYLDDNRTTPDTLDVLWEFDDFVLSFANKVHNGYTGAEKERHGIMFHGTKGTLRVDRNGYELFPGIDKKTGKPFPDVEAKKSGGSQMYDEHWANFIECIRTREKPIAHVEACHNSSTICHMGTCAYVAGGKLGWDGDTEKFVGGDREAVEKANAFAYRPYQNGWTLG